MVAGAGGAGGGEIAEANGFAGGGNGADDQEWIENASEEVVVVRG